MDHFEPQPEKRALQLRELEILRMFKQVCEQHQLTYFLVAGTLLGAVRHQGFIPWDDDIDVAMPREDFDRLAKILSSRRDEKLFWQDEHTDPFYHMSFGKLRLNGTVVQEPHLKRSEMHQGIYIDIFPLDHCPENQRAASLLFKLNNLFTIAAGAKLGVDQTCGYQKKSAILAYQLLRRLPARAVLQARRVLLFISNHLCTGRCLCSIGGAHGYPRETYRREWVAVTAEMVFEGDAYPVPVGWDEVLKNMYGDYMSPPPVSERQGHFEARNGGC